MRIKRDSYLRQLLERQQNGLIKVICGLRRCGKSFLLFTIFQEYLKAQGVDDSHIISLTLDDDLNAQYRDPDTLSAYIRYIPLLSVNIMTMLAATELLLLKIMQDMAECR